MIAPVLYGPDNRPLPRPLRRRDRRTRRAAAAAPAFPAPAPSDPAPSVAAGTDLGAVLSPSQIRQYLACSARWWFKYGMKLPDPMTGSLCLGRSLHKAVAIYFRERLRGNVIDTADAIEAYELAWEENAEDTQFAADEDVAGTKGAGATLVAKYLAEAAPKIEPAALDLHVTGEIGGVAVQGYIDILAADGTIIDLKTAKAKPSGVSPDYAFQIATYRQLCPQSNGKAKLTTLVRTKTPQRVEQEYTVSAEDQTQTRVLYPLVQQSIREGRYLPNRNDNLCSRRNCAFWAACEKEYGGRVEE